MKSAMAILVFLFSNTVAYGICLTPQLRELRKLAKPFATEFTGPDYKSMAFTSRTYLSENKADRNNELIDEFMNYLSTNKLEVDHEDMRSVINVFYKRVTDLKRCNKKYDQKHNNKITRKFLKNVLKEIGIGKGIKKAKVQNKAIERCQEIFRSSHFEHESYKGGHCGSNYPISINIEELSNEMQGISLEENEECRQLADIPKDNNLIHYIWFGGTLGSVGRESDMEKMVNNAKADPDKKFLVWVSDEQLRRDGLDGRKGVVRDFQKKLNLKENKNIQLLSIDSIQRCKGFPPMNKLNPDSMIIDDTFDYIHEEITHPDKRRRNYAAGSDIARVMLGQLFGGFYIDTDVSLNLAIQPPDVEFQILRPEDRELGINNAMMFSKSGSEFLKHYWRNMIDAFKFLKNDTEEKMVRLDKTDEEMVNYVWDLNNRSSYYLYIYLVNSYRDLDREFEEYNENENYTSKVRGIEADLRDLRNNQNEENRVIFKKHEESFNQWSQQEAKYMNAIFEGTIPMQYLHQFGSYKFKQAGYPLGSPRVLTTLQFTGPDMLRNSLYDYVNKICPEVIDAYQVIRPFIVKARFEEENNETWK